MNRLYAFLALLAFAPGAAADSWTYLATLNGGTHVPDGQYDLRLTFMEPRSPYLVAPAMTLEQVAVVDGAFSVTFEPNALIQAHDRSAPSALVLKTEIAVDGKHFSEIGLSTPFDPANAQRGVCWEAPAGDARNEVALACLMTTTSIAKIGPIGGVYELRKQVIAGGGSALVGGNYALVGTVGQSAVTRVSGGVYQLAGGFHGPMAPLPDSLFANGFEN